MSLLRDVIARFSVTVDDKPLNELDKKLKKARETVNTMGKYVAATWAGAGAAAYGLVTAASNANENLNVLQQTFKGNSDAVVSWSKTLGKEMGRSEYTLQEAAGKFGSFLSPVFKDSGQDVTAMSEDLSKLAVDLASFYNTSDEEAVMRLFSGMSGETEAVRRLGIDISDTSLDDLNKKNGDSRRLASLTLAEKSALRFQKIMQDTKDKQGDAARTSDQWANSLKRGQEELKTLATTLGQRLMPYALRLLRWAESYLPVIEDVLLQSDAIEAGFRLLAIVTGVTAAAFVALNFPMILMASLAGALNLAFEDLLVFLDGGHSVLGDFITIVTGVTDPLKFFNNVLDDIIGVCDILLGTFMDLAINIARVVTGAALAEGFTNENGDAARGRAGMREKNAGGVLRGQDQARAAAAASGDEAAFRQAYQGSTMTGDQLTESFKKYRQIALDESFAKGTDLKPHPADAELNTHVDQFGRLPFDQKFLAPGAVGGSGSTSSTVNSLTFHVVGDAKEIAKQVQSKLDEQKRKTAAAVGEEKTQ